MPTNWDKMAAEAARTAIRSGWWITPRSDEELAALINSEVGEAVECIRMRQNELWFRCVPENKGHTNRECGGACTAYPKCRGGKPEGLPAELADIIIRIMDMMKHQHLKFPTPKSAQYEFYTQRSPLAGLAHLAFTPQTDWYAYINQIAAYARAHRINLLNSVRIKMRYNRHRSWRHGNKAA